MVVGGGYLGLWTALLAKEREPGRDVLLLEAGRCGDAASGRNGGFCEASLTHGFGNGLARWPDELGPLDRMGRENLDGIERTIAKHAHRLRLRAAGHLAWRPRPTRSTGSREEHDAMRARAIPSTWLDEAGAARAGGLTDLPRRRCYDPRRRSVEPARLAWGLREACLAVGVRICEDTPVTGLSPATAPGSTVATAAGRGDGAARWCWRPTRSRRCCGGCG